MMFHPTRNATSILLQINRCYSTTPHRSLLKIQANHISYGYHHPSDFICSYPLISSQFPSLLPHTRPNSSSTTATLSQRAILKSTPVNKSILSYIETIGVGIPPPKKKKRRRKPSKSRELNPEEETKYLSRTSSERSFAVTPPPPFAGSSSSNENEEGRHNNGDETLNIVRFPVKLLKRVGSLEEEFPRSSKGLPEVAIAGRSNVGKSTLLNALLYGNIHNDSRNNTNTNHYHRSQRRRHRNIENAKLPRGLKAITSPKPGTTRQITFYQLSSRFVRQHQNHYTIGLLLADLPGYGFAYAKEEVSNEWNKLMKYYLLNREKGLKRILLLLDARHGFKQADLEFLRSLEDSLRGVTEEEEETKEDVDKSSKKTKKKKDTVKKSRSKITLPPIQIVLTKCDLVSQIHLAKRVVQVKAQLSDCLQREPSSLPVMLVSAKAGLGFNNVRGYKARGGILELQRELAALVPRPKV